MNLKTSRIPGCLRSSNLKSLKQTRSSVTIDKNYPSWFNKNADAPIMSHTLFKEKVLPEINKEQPTLLVVIDNMRYDQWKAFEPVINTYYKKEQEIPFFSILPTATQYARNAMFSGLMPSEMEKLHPTFGRTTLMKAGKTFMKKSFCDAS